MGFFYSFIETFLHSLWQSCLLLLFYVCINFLYSNTHPLQKRNYLYSLLVTQCVISFCTFYIYFTNISFGKNLSFTELIPNGNSILNFFYKYADAIFFIYAVIVGIKFSTVYLQWKSFQKNYRKNLITPDVTMKVFADLKAYQLGIKRKISLWYSHNLNAPVTFGFLKPIILLPFSLLNNCTTEEVEAIILHELAHVKNKDFLLNWLLMAVEIFYFYNPFIKILAGKIKTEREKNCDIVVINFKYDSILYAQVLLKIARKSIDVKSFQLGAVKKRSILFNRICFFTDERNMAFENRPSIAFYYLLIPVLLALSVMFFPAKVSLKNNNTIINSLSNNFEKPKYFKVSANTAKSKTSVIKKNTPQKINKNIEILTTDIKINLKENNLTTNDNTYLNVAMNETIDSVKEIIYNVETQQGKFTQYYKMVMIKGIWTLQPQWMLVETNADSTFGNKTDSSFNILQAIQ